MVRRSAFLLEIFLRVKDEMLCDKLGKILKNFGSAYFHSSYAQRVLVPLCQVVLLDLWIENDLSCR